MPILADVDSPEPERDFPRQLTGSVGANITDAQAVAPSPPPSGGRDSPSAASHLRSGGAGRRLRGDLQQLDSPHRHRLAHPRVTASSASARPARHAGADWHYPEHDGHPGERPLPPRRSPYSLTNYGGTGAAAGNLTMSLRHAEDGNVASFNTDNVANLSTATRLDAVGFGTTLVTTATCCARVTSAGSRQRGVGLAQHSFYASSYPCRRIR